MTTTALNATGNTKPERLAERLAAGVDLVIAAGGGQTELAEKLSGYRFPDGRKRRVRQSKVSMWKWRGRVPPEWVLPCETVVAVQRYDIRPDLHTRDHSPVSSDKSTGAQFAQARIPRKK